MSNFISQHVFNAKGLNLVATVVKLVVRSDTVELPRMSSTAGKVAQVRRSGDPKIVISQTDADTVTLTGNVGDEVLLLSLSDEPIPNPHGDSHCAGRPWRCRMYEHRSDGAACSNERGRRAGRDDQGPRRDVTGLSV